MSRRRVLTALASLVAVLAIGVGAVVAVAATRNGVTPVAPGEGDVVPKGKPPTFTVRARGGGQVFVRVCRSKSTRSDGLICAAESVGRAKRGDGGLYRYRPRAYEFDAYWLNRPGTYYWQAHRIKCERRRTKDCRQEGPVLSLKVE